MLYFIIIIIIVYSSDTLIMSLYDTLIVLVFFQISDTRVPHFRHIFCKVDVRRLLIKWVKPETLMM